MTRISRINAPRATLAAIALLAIFVLGLGALAEADYDQPAVAATEVIDPSACPAARQGCDWNDAACSDADVRQAQEASDAQSN